MRRSAFLVVLSIRRRGIGCVVLTAGPHAQRSRVRRRTPVARPATADDATRYAGVIKQYCAQCHNGRAPTSATASGVVFDTIDLRNVGATRRCGRRWCGSCGPARCRRPACRIPTPRRRRALLTWLEQRLDEAAATPNPGRPVLHRLNRTEYRNAVQGSAGRSTSATSRRCCRRTTRPTGSTRSPTSSACRRCCSSATSRRPAASARWPSATRTSCPAPTPMPARQDLSQDKHIDGMPFGTVGGIKANAHVPGGRRVRAAGHALSHQRGPDPRPRAPAPDRDGGRRRARVPRRRLAARRPATPAASDEAATGRGRLLSRSDAIDAQLQVRVHVKAGPRAVTAAFLQRSRAADSRKLQPYRSSFDTYDATGCAAHRDARREGAVHGGRAGRDAEPGARLHLPAGDRARRKSRARARSSRRWCAAPTVSRRRRRT